MTAEPKFVPEQAVEIQPDGKTTLSVRLIDTVGYLDPRRSWRRRGRQAPHGHDAVVPRGDPDDRGSGRLGTKKGHGRAQHDWDSCDHGRHDHRYPARGLRRRGRRAIADMRAAGKPFLVLVNSAQPSGEGRAGGLPPDPRGRRRGVHGRRLPDNGRRRDFRRADGAALRVPGARAAILSPGMGIRTAR